MCRWCLVSIATTLSNAAGLRWLHGPHLADWVVHLLGQGHGDAKDSLGKELAGPLYCATVYWYSHGEMDWYSHGEMDWYSHGEMDWYSHGEMVALGGGNPHLNTKKNQSD